jgi:hypothetical protein
MKKYSRKMAMGRGFIGGKINTNSYSFPLNEYFLGLYT